jgi:hypothetical protein
MVHRLNEVSGGEFFFQQDDMAMSEKKAKVRYFMSYSQSPGLVDAAPTIGEKA